MPKIANQVATRQRLEKETPGAAFYCPGALRHFRHLCPKFRRVCQYRRENPMISMEVAGGEGIEPSATAALPTYCRLTSTRPGSRRSCGAKPPCGALACTAGLTGFHAWAHAFRGISSLPLFSRARPDDTFEPRDGTCRHNSMRRRRRRMGAKLCEGFLRIPGDMIQRPPLAARKRYYVYGAAARGAR